MAPKAKIRGKYSYQGTTSKKASPGKIFGSIIFSIIIMTLTCILTAQFIAQKLNYPPVLGQPIALNNGASFYPPQKAFEFLYLLFKADLMNEIFYTGIIIMFGGVSLSGLFIGLSFKKRKASGREDISNVHGSAKWAERKDIVEAGLLPRPKDKISEVSVYVGGWVDPKDDKLNYLIHGGPEHILAFAPTRSGKGVGLVIPTLCRWAHSVVVYDIKGENYALTAGFRGSEEGLNQVIIKLDPTDPDAFEKGTSGTFNPLAELSLDYDYEEKPEKGEHPPMIRVGSGETANVQNLVTMIVDPDGKGLEDHWAKTAHSLIVGCVTHLLYKGKKEGMIPCLADVANEFTKPGVGWRENIETWQLFPHLGEDAGGPRIHPVVNNAAQEMLNRDDKEASSVLSTVVSYLTLYRDDVIANNTSRSTFKISDLMNYTKPVSLYLVVKPVDKDRIKPFVRLFITQVIRRLADGMKFENGVAAKTYEHRLLLLLDEFPSLGKLQLVEEALAFIAGYGLKAYLIIQDIAQLHKIYSKEESITGNCHVKIAYATSNPDTARYLSETSGTTTIVKESESVSSDMSPFAKKNISSSLQEISRPLLTVDECMRLKGPEKDASGKILVPGDMLVFVAGYPAIYGRQMLFFMDNELRRRTTINAPETSGWTVERNPNEKSRITSGGETEVIRLHPDTISDSQMDELADTGCIDPDAVKYEKAEDDPDFSLDEIQDDSNENEENEENDEENKEDEDN